MLPSALFPFCLVLALALSEAPSVTGLECSNDAGSSHLSDTSHSVVTADAEEARVSALCHVVCINYLFFPTVNSSANATMNMTSGNMTNNATNSDSEATMPGVYQIDRCQDLRKYLDCRSGCLAQSRGQCNDCTGRCQGICQFSKCDLLPLPGNRCGAQCHPDDCSSGCQQFTDLPSDSGTKPSDTPVLRSMNNQPIYDVEFPMELEMNMYKNPSLLFRIEHSPGQYVYQWMLDIVIVNIRDIMIADFMLDLSSYPTGSSVNVSFAYVTAELGLSPYSDPTTVTVVESFVLVPSSLNDTSHSVVTADAEEARVSALCHVVCINYLLFPIVNSSANATMNMTSGNMTSNATNSDSEAMMPGVYQIDRCEDLRKYLDCRSGCLAQSRGQCNDCAGRCQGICQFSKCDLLPIPGNRCGAQCHPDDCSSGCQQFTNLPSDSGTKPSDTPVLRSMNNQPIYDVEFPMELEMNMYKNPSLLFRIEHSPGQYVYQWMLDIVIVNIRDIMIADFMLDLSSYQAGSSVNVSFAYVTAEFGLSPYSDPTTVTVEGVTCFVRRLMDTEVEVTIVERDRRAGFFNHPVLNVSWCPGSCIEGVANYTVTRRNCISETVTDTVNANTTSVVLRSSDSSEFFALPCSPQLQVKVERALINGEIQSVTKTLFDYSVNVEHFPEIQLSYSLIPSRALHRYILDFDITTFYSPATLNVIDHFFVSVNAFRDRDTPVQLGFFSENIAAILNQNNYSTRILLDPITLPNHYYNVSATVMWKISDLPKLANVVSVRDVGPPLPLLANDVNVTKVTPGAVIQRNDFNDVEATATFQFESSQRSFFLNTPIQYDIHFGLQPANDDTIPNPPSNLLMVNGSSSRLQAMIFNTLRGVSKEINIINAYLQIRSYQFSDFRGNWSEPVTVQIPILIRPSPPNTLRINLAKVDVNYRDDETPRLALDGTLTWNYERGDDSIPQIATLSYSTELRRIGLSPSNNTQSVTERNLDGISVLLSDQYTGTLTAAVHVMVKLLTATESSPERHTTKEFEPLPTPQDISVSHQNPRLSMEGSSTMLSVDVIVDWSHPAKTEEIANYEIMFRTESALRAFDGFLDRSMQPIPSNATQFTKSIKREVTEEENIELYVQMRSIVSSNLCLLPHWTLPVTVPMVILSPPAINSSQLLSFSLVQENDQVSVDALVKVSWEEPEEGEEPEFYEIWVGSRPLSHFEEPPTDDRGVLTVVNATSENSTTTEGNTTASDNSTTTDNTTDLIPTISQNISASFSGSLSDTTVYVQIRSIRETAIPKWSTAIEYEQFSAPPPSNVEVVRDPEVIITETGEFDVKVELQWELPDTMNVEMTEAPETPTNPSSAVSPTVSMTPSTSFLLPSPSPSPSPNERVRRQANNESSSNETETEEMDNEMTVSLGSITAVYAYMGTTRLGKFSPRPKENVEVFKADDTSGTVQMNYTFNEEKEAFRLFIQMQIETEEGYPEWSDATEIIIEQPGKEPTKEPTKSPITDGVTRDEADVPVLAIVLSIVGAIILALVIAIAIVIFFIYYNRRKYRHIKDPDDALEIYSRPGLTGLYSGKGPILDEWEISTDDVIVDELLGEGAFGEVYKGVIRGPLENPKISAVLRQAIGVPVAIKLLKTTSAGKEKADFLAEIDMMKKIAEGYNAHIVNMVGCVTLQEPLCLITEFVPFGDLLSYLKHQRKKRSEIRRREKIRQQQTGDDEYEIMIRRNGDATVVEGEGVDGGQGSHTYESTTTGGDNGDGHNSANTRGEGGYEAPKPPSPTPYLEPANAYSHLDPKSEDQDTEPLLEDDSHYRVLGDLEPDDLIRFAYQIASGMEYLASLNIVHRDLACRNVLISNDKLLKITDFGLSREVQEVYVKKTKGRLPLKWMAIESITAREFTTASDVWAFGVALYEIGTIGGFPYPSINNEDLLRMLSQGYRLEKPENCSADVYALMLDCWQEDPHDRPSFSNLRSKFSAMLQAGSAETYIDLQVNEEAPYYQFKDEERRESSDSESSESSIDSITKEKKPKGEKKKLKRKKTNPYVQTPQPVQGEGNGVVIGGGDGYIAMESASLPAERPIQLGIPISQLMPSDNNAADETETPIDNRRTNPYVSEPSEVVDTSLVASSVILAISLEGGAINGDMQGSNPELVESTHL